MEQTQTTRKNDSEPQTATPDDAATIVQGDGSITPTLMMLQGLPASGKTTYAKSLVAEGNWIRVNKDDLREMMDNGRYSKSNEKRVIRIRNSVVIDALATGHNVVVDDTNFAPYHAEALNSIAVGQNANFRIRFVDTPLEDCLARNKARDYKVPQQTIVDMYNKYLKPEDQEPKEEVNESQLKDLPECIIVDIDGTLSHIDSNNPRNVYDASRAMEDLLDDAVSNIVGMAYQNGYRVVIFSGRSRRHQMVTEEWLKANGVNYDEIHTRMDNDNRPDTVVKKEMYQAFIQDKYHVKYVIDDRPSVCRMWRDELKLHVFQVGDPHKEF